MYGEVPSLNLGSSIYRSSSLPCMMELLAGHVTSISIQDLVMWGQLSTAPFKWQQLPISCNVMHLFAKLKPFEQKEHFSLKEQNGLGWNQAYVGKGLDGQGDQTHDLQVGSRALLPTDPPIPFYLTPWLADLYAQHQDLTEWENACPSGMVDDCIERLVASSSSFDSFYDHLLLVGVQLSIKSILFDYCLYHWSVRTIMYVQFHNICRSV